MLCLITVQVAIVSFGRTSTKEREETIIPTNVRYWPFVTLKIKEIQQVEIFFSLFFFLLFFRNGKKKTRKRQGMRWISGTITYENTASGANKGPINYYKEILIFIVRVYIYNMYTRGRVMHRDTNNCVIIVTLHLRYRIIAYLCITNEVRFDRVEERGIRRIPIDRVPTQACVFSCYLV